MPHVRVSVYAFQRDTAEEALQRARDTALPLYRQRPGFVAYELIQTGGDSGIGISTWDTAAQAESSTEVDDRWITEHGFTTVSWVQGHVGRVYYSSRERMGGSPA
jgi:hypothetical protein